MELIFIVLLILIAAVVTVAVKEDNNKNIAATEVKNKCGCGKTKNPDGYCDGSHMKT